MMDALALSEQDKYRRMWAVPEYARYSPGEKDAVRFMAQAKPMLGQSVIDFGAGTGRGSAVLAEYGLKPTLVDFVMEASEVLGLYPHVEACLWDETALSGLSADWLYCVDVMEHIPEEKVNAVLANAAAATRIGGYFSINLGHDGFGRMIDEVLHVTVKPPEWWVDRIAKHFKKTRLLDVSESFKAMVYV